MGDSAVTRAYRIAIVSDIHYAGAAEQARGDEYEFRMVSNPLLRLALKFHRRFLWLHRPLHQNHLLDEFLTRVGPVDLAVANGDYSCDTAFIGPSDPAARQSAAECLQKLREKFAPNFQAVFGDHELGKGSFVGKHGGMRLASWTCAREDLGLQPFWRMELGRYVLLAVTSSLVALPVFEADSLPEELPEWRRLREEHMAIIRQNFAALKPDQRVLLFCHDPTALPFLGREAAVREKLPQIERTIIGHLHSNLVLWKGRMLAGMPPIHFLGHSVKRMTTALSEGRHWQPFNVLLCPAIAGVQLLKDGGYYTADLDLNAQQPARLEFHALPR